jgi:hypothetical protein
MGLRRWADLEALVDETLVEVLPADLRAAIDRALTAGATQTQVLRWVRAAAGGRGLTTLAVEAYLSADQHGRA